MEPTIKKIRLCKPYLVHPETNQIYAQYSVVIKWPDGTRKSFDSEEHANAYIAGRRVNALNIEHEVPAGYRTALELIRLKNQPPPPIKEAPKQEWFDVIMTSFGSKKIQVIKAVRELTGLGLKESKELVTSVPIAVKKELDKENAEDLKERLVAVGATVEIV